MTQLGTIPMHEHGAGADQLFASLGGAEPCRQIRFVHGPNEYEGCLDSLVYTKTLAAAGAVREYGAAGSLGAGRPA